MDADPDRTPDLTVPPQTCDIAVIGGGAAGMMAAIAAASQGHRPDVAILEGQERLGRKLLATGNGRCNLGHREWTPDNYHGRHPLFALEALRQLNVDDTLGLFRQLGLLCRIDGDGRIFPYSLQASAVLDIFRLRLDRLGVRVLAPFKVEKLAPRNVQGKPAGFQLVSADGRSMAAGCVIVATGGLAAPSFGCDGSGYSLMKRLGHNLVAPFPAIVQICTVPSLVRPLAGIKCDGRVSVQVDGQVRRTETGEILFTEYGLSGPPVLQLSRIVGECLPDLPVLPDRHRSHNRTASPPAVLMLIDFLPEMTDDDVTNWLEERCQADPECPLPDFLTGLVHKKLGQAILKQAIGRSLNGDCRSLSGQDLVQTSRHLKHWAVQALGTRGWSQAQVTAGGLDSTQFHADTLESRLIPGLYAAGEILDIDGDCGGFNLQWAWSSGWLAGCKAAARSAAATGKAGQP